MRPNLYITRYEPGNNSYSMGEIANDKRGPCAGYARLHADERTRINTGRLIRG